MVFTKRLREGVRRGFITSSVRIWKHPHVKVGGRYPMEEGEIVIDSIEPISLQDVTHDLAIESGFESRAPKLTARSPYFSTSKAIAGIYSALLPKDCDNIGL